MARVLLVAPPLLLHNDFIDYPYFASAGVWQAAANLRAAGHDVAVHDAFCLPSSNLLRERGGMIRLGVPWTSFNERLPERAPDIVVIGNNPWLRARAAAAELQRFVTTLATRWPDVPTILADCDVGGMHFIDWDGTDLDEVGIAFGCKYESERALAALIERICAGGHPDHRIVLGVPDDTPLDELPLPAYDLVDFSAFQRFMGRVTGTAHKREIFACNPPIAAIKTSRGCVYSCNFCTSNAWAHAGHEGRAYRTYSKDRLREHLELLKNAHGIDRVVVLDELVNVNPRHFDDLLELLNELGMRADFPNGMRADRLVRGQITALARVTPVLSISAEAATERVANDIIGKRFDREATNAVAAWCKEDGLPLVVHWMIGQPGETRAEIKRTVETAWQLFEDHGAQPLLQFATPIKGTALHDEVTRRKLWTRREDRDIGPLFQGQPVFEDQDWTGHDLHVAQRVMQTRLDAHVPKKVIMNTTYICNNQCVFCATGNRLPSHGSVQEQIEFMQVRREQGFHLIDFDGGEPTTNPNLFKLLKTARDLGYEAINVTTNGRMMMLPRNAEKIVRSPITSLLVSLHGPNEEVHEEQVQSRGAFAQTVRGIANARPLCDKLGKYFGVNVTLTRTNFPVLMEYGELLVSLGVRNCNIQFVTPFGRASLQTQPDPAEIAPVVAKLIDTYKDRIKFQVINLPLCYMPGYEEYLLGDIFKLERRMCFVSIEDVNLFEYLQSRRRHEPACDSCLVKFACQGFYYVPDEWKDEAQQRWND